MDDVLPVIGSIALWFIIGFFLMMAVGKAKTAIRARRRPPALPRGLGLTGEQAITEYTQAELRHMQRDAEYEIEWARQDREAREERRREEHRQEEIARAQAEAEQRRRGNIIAAGTMDVMKAWYEWATDALTLEAEYRANLQNAAEAKIQTGGMDPETAAKTAWHEDTVRRKEAVENLSTLTATILDDTWTVSQLQIHGYRILECIALAGDLEPAHEHLCRVSALIADQRDDVFDVEKAPITTRYAYAEDEETRTLYLQGRSLAVEQIIDAHTEARLYLDRIRQAREAVRAANQQQTSYIRGIRETNQHAANRDQEIEWQRQLDAIEGNPTP